MLLFISIGVSFRKSSVAFQYISCYCLSMSENHHGTFTRISIHLMLLFIRIARLSSLCQIHFNTSHVTVYRIGKVTIYI